MTPVSGNTNNGRDRISGNPNRPGINQQGNSNTLDPNRTNRGEITGSGRPSRVMPGNSAAVPERSQPTVENNNRRAGVTPQTREPQYRNSSPSEQLQQRRMSEVQRSAPATRNFEGSRQQMQSRESSPGSNSSGFDRPSRSFGEGRASEYQRANPSTRGFEGSRQQMQPRQSSPGSGSSGFHSPSRGGGSGEHGNSGGGGEGGRRSSSGRRG